MHGIALRSILLGSSQSIVSVYCILQNRQRTPVLQHMTSSLVDVQDFTQSMLQHLYMALLL